MEDAYAAADIVCSGFLSEANRGEGFGGIVYTFNVEKLWKAQGSISKFKFQVHHSSCAKYRSRFPAWKKVTVGDRVLPQGWNQKKRPVIGYFKKEGENWTLLRFAPSSDNWNLKTETEFVKKQQSK